MGLKNIDIPNITGKIEKRISRRLNRVRTTVPAIVEKIHKEEMKIDVTIKSQWTNEPIYIENVRVLYPQSNKNKYLFGLEEKDTVMLLFSKVDLISLQNKGYVNVDETPSWKFKNTVAIPGIHLDQLLLDKYDESEIQGEKVEIPDGINILSEDEIIINGESVKIKTDLSLEDNKITNLKDPENDQDAATMKWVMDAIGDEEIIAIHGNDRHEPNFTEETVFNEHKGNVGTEHHGLVDTNDAGFMSSDQYDKLESVEWDANNYELEEHNHSDTESGGSFLNPDEVETNLKQVLPQYDSLLEAPDEKGSIIYLTPENVDLIEGVYKHDGLSYRLLTDKTYVDFVVANLGINYFLTDEDSGIDDPDDNEYKKISLEPVDIPEQSISVSGSNADDYHIQSWICPEDYFPTELLGGLYSLKIDAERTDGTRRVRLFYRAYERKDDGTEEFIIESNNSKLITSRESIIVSARFPYYKLDEGSCVVFKLYMRREQEPSSDEVTVYYGGNNDANISLPTSTVILDEIYASNPHTIGGEQHASDTLANVSGKIQEDIDSLFTTPAQHDLDMDGKDIENINELDWSDGIALPRIYEGEDEPDIPSGRWCVWADNENKLWLVVNYDNDKKMVELW